MATSTTPRQGFYYLQSRYYDPEIGRFINADGQLNGGLLGNNLYAYCENNPVNYYDPEGDFAISAVIIGVIIGAAIGFGATAYVDYADDGEVFNGSVSVEGYVVNTLVGGLVGAFIGGVGSSTFTFSIPEFALLQTTINTYELVVVGTTTVTVNGLIVAGAGIATLGIFFSKEEPKMKNKPPFSWTSTNEGIEAMKKFGLNSEKAAEDIMNSHFDGWHKGGKYGYNAIKKWLDRVIRKMITGGK